MAEEAAGPTYMDRKLEVRNRMEELARTKKKKGFMTPERKKKLRVLLANHARKKIIEEHEEALKIKKQKVQERCGKSADLSGLSDDQLRAICKQYHDRIKALEGEKFDLEKTADIKQYQIEETNIAVNNLRGKFVKPSLKKVSKYDNKFAKLQKKAAEFNFRQNLKVVKKKEFTMDEEDLNKKKPEWTKGEKSKSFSSDYPPESPTLMSKELHHSSSEEEEEGNEAEE